MKRKFEKTLAIFCFIAILLVLGSLNLNIMSTSEITGELSIKNKTLTSIAISWEQMGIPDDITSYKVYKNDQLMTTITTKTTKTYTYTGLTNGTAYNLKVEFLDASNTVVSTKEMLNIKPAVNITSLSQNMVLTKDTYYFSGSLIIPEGVTIEVEAGSIIKNNMINNILIVNGTLKLNGIAEEKVTFTSATDTTDPTYFWKQIKVNSTGTFEANNAIIRYGGQAKNLYQNELKYVDSTGIIKLNNCTIQNVATTLGILGSTIEVNSSNMSTGIESTDTLNIDIQNSTISKLDVKYSVGTITNNVNILNNNLTSGIVYIPNNNSVANIKNNNANISYSSAVQISLENANSEIMRNIQDNINTSTNKYGDVEITTMPSISYMLLPKNVYSIRDLIINGGLILEFSKGSTIRLKTKLIVNGTLKLNGTEEEKVIVTSATDINNSTYYWLQMKVNSTGTFEANNAIIKYGGQAKNLYQNEFKYIDSEGILKLNNLKSESVSTAIGVIGGYLELHNSNLDKGVEIDNIDNIDIKNTNVTDSINFNNVKNIDIENNIINNGINIKYDNPVLANNITILNNTITNSLTYTPNMFSIANIKNNISISNYPIILKIQDPSSDILKDVSNNRNTTNISYDGIYINGTLNNLKLYNCNQYIFGTTATIASDKRLEIEKGTICKFVQNGLLTVNGSLYVEGTQDQEVIFTSIKDPALYTNPGTLVYGQGIRVNAIGYAQINNMNMRYCGYASSIASIQNYGIFALFNSSITNSKSGIDISYSTQCENPKIRNNYISGRINSNIALDAKENYWGSPSGPGSRVTSNVTWNPCNATYIKSEAAYQEYVRNLDLSDRQHFGEPGINGYSGNYSKSYDDLNVVIPNVDLKFNRTYNSNNKEESILGKGWTFGFSSKIKTDENYSDVKYVYLPNGSVNAYIKQTDGSFLSINSRNSLTFENDIYVLTTKSQTKYLFDTNGYLHKVIDKYGNETNITVDSEGKITNITDYAGRQYNISYNDGKIVGIVDPENRQVIYTYNEKGLLASVTGVNSKTTYYEYDVNDKLTVIKEEKDATNVVQTEKIEYYIGGTYDGRVYKVTDVSGKIDTYTYDLNARSVNITDQNSRVSKKYYDSTGYIKTEVEPDNSQTTYVYELSGTENKYGDIKSSTDITGKNVTYVRDTKGNITKQTNSDNSYKLYEYNSKNSMTKQTDELGNVTQFVYDSDGVTLIKKILPNNAEVNYEYYTSGIKGFIKKQIDALGNVTNYEYDLNGNLKKIIEANGDVQTFSYNSIGWLLNKTSAKGYVTNYQYDLSGNKTKTIEDNGATTTNRYNYDNNITKTTNPDGGYIEYEYDNANNLTKKIDEKFNVTRYEYDIYNNLVKQIQPNGAIYKYYYDNLNRNIKSTVMINDNEVTLSQTSYSYSSGNKTITTKNYVDATNYSTNIKIYNYLDKITQDKTEDAQKTYTYYTNGALSSEQNEIGRKIYYQYNNIGKVSTKYEEIDTEKYSKTSYTYDLNGNILTEETSKEKVNLFSNPSTTITKTYTYDNVGNIISKTSSSGEESKYYYDKDKNIVKQEDKIADGRYKVTEYEYNYAKKVTAKKEYVEKGSLVDNVIGDTSLAVLTTSFEYDYMNNLTKEIMPDGKVINHYYDKLQRKVKDESILNGVTITETYSYLYDSKEKLTSKTDGNGNSINYEYDTLGNVIKEIKPNDTITTYEYNSGGYVLKEILPNNVNDAQNCTTFTYDKYGNVVTKTKNYVDGGSLKQIVTTYEYDKAKNLLKETTAEVSTSSTYNKASKVASKTDGNNNTTNYTYDALLNLTLETDAKGIETKYYYDDRNNLVRKYVDDFLQEENTYDLLNNLISKTDELEKVVTNEYDLNGNVIKTTDTETGYYILTQYNLNKEVARTIDNTDKETLFVYDILGNVIEKTEQKSDSTEKITVKEKYDNVGNKIEETDGNGNVTSYEYDQNNNLVKSTNPKNQITTYTYDKNGNKLTETDHLLNTKTYIYDKLDRIVEKKDEYNNRVEKLVYDDLSRQIKSIDANDNAVEFTFDNNSNILTKKDEEGKIETYEYDSLNNKTKYIDKNSNVTKYFYDNRSRLIKVTNALNEDTTYTYDNMGNMLTQKDAKQNVTQFVYDKNSNEIKKIDQLENEETKTYSIDGLQLTYTTNNGDLFEYKYDIHGRLVEEKVGQDVTVYEYDNNGNKTRLGNVTKTYDNLDRVLSQTENGQTVTYTYDDSLNTKTTTDSKSNVKVEEYDKVGRLLKVTNNSKVTEYVYNIDGTVQKQINPNNVTSYEYYFDKKLKRLTTKDLSDIVIEEDYYEYDNNNNILKENDKIYTYDALNRVKAAQNTEYSYDMAGNILSKSELDGNDLKVTTYEYNAKNQLTKTTTVENLTPVSESTYTYDNNGNQLTETTSSETKTNTYNPRNELVEVKNGQTVVANYAYNALGKRIQKKVGTEEINYVYDEDRIILELDALYNQIAANTFGLALIKRTTTEDGYYVYNGHGDVKKLVNDSNIVLNTYEYDEFGKILGETGSYNNSYKYAGYYYDNETATYYLQARYYNPQIQRFISEDTYRGEIDDPLSLNLYAYCVNNPMIYVDPTGHFFEKIAEGFNYYKKRENAFCQASAEFIVDSAKGLAQLAWNLGETLGSEIGFFGNEIGYRARLINESAYLNIREQSLNTISNNMDIYKQIPGNTVTGIIDNFKMTFNVENFLNYFDPNTSYTELKDYSKSVIQTGVTIYGGVKMVQAAYSSVSAIVTKSNNISSISFNNGSTSYKLKTDTSKMRYTLAKNSNYNTNVGYSSFNELKKIMGPAGKGKQWHHIVEQSQIKKSGFMPEQIHNTNNIISIEKSVHSKISGFYSSKPKFAGGSTVRDWLSNKSFDYQYNYGNKILQKFNKLN